MASKTSQLDLHTGEVILKIGSVWTEKFKVKVYANQEKSLSHINTLIKNVFRLNFRHELLMSFWKFISKLHRNKVITASAYPKVLAMLVRNDDLQQDT